MQDVTAIGLWIAGEEIMVRTAPLRVRKSGGKTILADDDVQLLMKMADTKQWPSKIVLIKGRIVEIF